MTLPLRTTRSRVAAAAISGLLLGLCFPNFSFLFLLPVALIPFLLALEESPVKAGLLSGAAFGVVFWVTTIPWIGYTVHRFGEMPWPVAVLSVFLSALILCPPFAILGGLVAAARPRGAWGAWTFGLVFVAAWVVEEGLRTYVFGGFPWALLAYALADRPEWIQTAAYGGAALTGALVAGLNAALFGALRAREAKARVSAFVAALVLVVVAALPAARASRTPADATWVRVGVVQPNVQQEIRWVPGEESIEAELFQQTRVLVDSSTPRPALVLWPESALPHGWQRVRPQVEALCREKDVAILLNTVWVDAGNEAGEPGAEPPYYNAALLVTKDGPVLPPYKKVRLVPFGEYVPLGPLLRKIRPISRAVPGSFTPGDSPMAIPFGAVKLGGAVCYEVVYPWIQREAARRGANLLFTLTNDAWYGTLGARHQHWQAAVFRAVETGRPLVRAAITGISGAVDPRGVVKARIGEDVKGSFVVDLALGGPPAPAVAVGEAPLVICAAFLFAVILRARTLKPREPAAI